MPWHSRTWTAADQKRLRDLADLHALSLALLREMQVDSRSPEPAELTALRSNNARSLDSPLLESMLDERQADELVSDLHFLTLEFHYAAVDTVASTRHQPLGESRIVQAAWDEGRMSARLRWPSFNPLEGGDLRDILSALKDSGIEDALVCRSTRQLIELELNRCPHSETPAFPAVQLLDGPVRDLFCQIHRAYRQGFAQALNPRLRVSSGRSASACQQQWRI